MENVLSLRHNIDLDMPRRIREKTYKRLLLNLDSTTTRISTIISSVKGPNAAHLDFCFTGITPYGGRYMCAVWPRQPEKVIFNFSRTHGQSYTTPIKGMTVFGYETHYIFCQENPHLPHRPYYFSSYDEIFRKDDEDEEKILRYHKNKIIAKWRSSRNFIDRIVSDEITLGQLKQLDHIMSDLDIRDLREKLT